MPPSMSKRELNTTRLQHRPQVGDVVLWKVGLIFILGNQYTAGMLTSIDLTNSSLKCIDMDRGLVSVCMSSVNENRTIEEIVEEIFDNNPVSIYIVT
jgi:hypothetical protein